MALRTDRRWRLWAAAKAADLQCHDIVGRRGPWGQWARKAYAICEEFRKRKRNPPRVRQSRDTWETAMRLERSLAQMRATRQAKAGWLRWAKNRIGNATRRENSYAADC